MKTIVAAARDFARDEDGVTAIEYGLIAAGIAVVLGASVALLGPKITAAFNAVIAKFP